MTHFLATNIPVANPFAKFRPPIFQKIRLRIFNALSISKSTLSTSSRDHMDCVQIDFQPFAWFGCDLLLRAPSTTVTFLAQPGKSKYFLLRSR